MKLTTYLVMALLVVGLLGAAAQVGVPVAGEATVSGAQAGGASANGGAEPITHSWLAALALAAFVCVLGFFFAKVEIQIEGAQGWAAALPTWRIEKHPLLDIFWGGRAMTGYHFWVFTFMFLLFHLVFFLQGGFSIWLECRVLGSLAIFWIVEDFLWFVLNPHYGIGKFNRAGAPWHKRWLLGVPVDYLFFSIVGVALVIVSYVKGSAA